MFKFDYTYYAKTAKLYKKGVALSEKICEIKGSGHGMIAMMLTIINFNNGFAHY